MNTDEIKVCGCGWTGTPKIKHVFEKNNYGDGCITHIQYLYCQSCANAFEIKERVLAEKDLQSEEKILLGVEIIPLPHKFRTNKYELTVEDHIIIIYDLDINNGGISRHVFEGKNKVECIGDLFYEITHCPNKQGNKFNIEYKITESEVDSFCEYMMENFSGKIHLPKPSPQTPQLPWSVPGTIPINTPPVPIVPYTRPQTYPGIYPKPFKKSNPWAEMDEDGYPYDDQKGEQERINEENKRKFKEWFEVMKSGNTLILDDYRQILDAQSKLPSGVKKTFNKNKYNLK